jgi:hypothetical protein
MRERVIPSTSQAVFFTIVIAGLSRNLGGQLARGAAAVGLPLAVSGVLASIPPGSAIFAALMPALRTVIRIPEPTPRSSAGRALMIWDVLGALHSP